MPANPKLSSEVHPGRKKFVLVSTVKFLKVDCNLQLCNFRNSLLTGRYSHPGVQILHGLRKISVGLFLDYKRIIFGLQKKSRIISWITKKGVGLFSDYKKRCRIIFGLFFDYI